MGKFGQDTRVTPLLFFEGHPGIFNDHRDVTYIGRNSTGSTRHQKGGGAANDSTTL